MKYSEPNKQRKVIITLILIVIILLGFILYSFVVQPSIKGYILSKQIEAQQLIVNTLIDQVQQYGYVQIPINDKEILTLVPYIEPTSNNTSR